MEQLFNELGNNLQFRILLFTVILILILNIYIKVKMYFAILKLYDINKALEQKNQLEYEKIRLLRELVNAIQQNATCDNLRHCDK